MMMNLLVILSTLAHWALAATIQHGNTQKTYIATIPKDSNVSFSQSGADVVRRLGATHIIPFDINGFRGFIFKGDENLITQAKSSQLGLQIYEDGQVKGQQSPVWGLDRINQRDLPLDNNADFGSATGEGVTVYVVDSGILVTHPEFEGRATWGANFIDDNKDEDCIGHGTHVAGTIISKTYGVAKKAKAIAVKVLDCSNQGTWSGVLKGLEWAVKDVLSKGLTTAVVNLSLGGRRLDPVNEAVNAVVDAGIHVVVAAGNDANDACLRSPASAEKSFTIGATNVQDQLADFSNFGTCVHLNAPGVNITSTSNKGQTAVLSGTSMATPHVAGVLALHLQTQAYTPADLKAKVIELSTKDRITRIPTAPATPNRLLFFGASDTFSCLPAQEKHGNMFCDGLYFFIICNNGSPFNFAVPPGTKCTQLTPKTVQFVKV
jgi:subtilisin family serine protease